MHFKRDLMVRTYKAKLNYAGRMLCVDVSGHVPDAYDPQYVEAAWNGWWQQSRIFTPEHAKVGYN
jgi:valyl-tRNA synthetase